MGSKKEIYREIKHIHSCNCKLSVKANETKNREKLRKITQLTFAYSESVVTKECYSACNCPHSSNVI